MDDVVDTFGRLGKYMGTVLGGLAIHALISLPIVFIIGKVWLSSPITFGYLNNSHVLNGINKLKRKKNRS